MVDDDTEEDAAVEAEVSKDDDAPVVEVDAAAYMSEIRDQVKQLRSSLALTKKQKEDAIRKDLLAFIRTLPEKEMQDLSSTMSEDVLVAMKGLVNVVIAGMGDGQIGPETLTEQSGEAMAQLIMWQLVLGYNLRELEVREEMKKKLLQPTSGGDGDSTSTLDEDGVDTSEEGAFE